MSTPSSALSAGGQFGSGIAGFLQSRRAADLARQQAKRRAKAIERQAFRELGTARAALGRSGVRIDAGTAFDVQFDLLLELERAAAQQVFEGQLAAFRLEQAGIQSLTSGLLGGAVTAQQSFGGAARGTIAQSSQQSGSGGGSGGGSAGGAGGGGSP